MKPLTLIFKPSYYLLAILAGMGLGCLLILLLVPMPVLMKLALMLLVLCSTAYNIFKYALLRLPGSCLQLRMTADSQCFVTLEDGTETEVQIQPHSFVASYLTIINYKQPGKFWQQHAVILPDSLDAEAFRMLRVNLRWGYREGAAADAF